MSEFSGEGDSSGETTETPRVVAEVKPISREGISAISGPSEVQPEVTESAESPPAATGTENSVAAPVTLPSPDKQFAPPGTGGPNDEALAKERPSRYMSAQGTSAMSGKKP